MSSTSQKHRSFTSEPMRNKPVTALPGVGKVIGQRLTEQNYSQATNVLGEYLVRGGDKHNFESWMKQSSGANSKQAGDCYRGVREWTNEFM